MHSKRFCGALGRLQLSQNPTARDKLSNVPRWSRVQNWSGGSRVAQAQIHSTALQLGQIRYRGVLWGCQGQGIEAALYPSQQSIKLDLPPKSPANLARTPRQRSDHVGPLHYGRVRWFVPDRVIAAPAVRGANKCLAGGNVRDGPQCATDWTASLHRFWYALWCWRSHWYHRHSIPAGNFALELQLVR